MFSFEKLEVWKRSLDFANELFEVTDRLLQKHQFSLGNQLRRAALSIPTIIVEGSGRSGGKEQAYFYGAAKGWFLAWLVTVDVARLNAAVGSATAVAD